EVEAVLVVDGRRLAADLALPLEERRDLARVLAAAGDRLEPGHEGGQAHADADPAERQDHEEAQPAARRAVHGDIQVPTRAHANGGAARLFAGDAPGLLSQAVVSVAPDEP